MSIPSRDPDPFIVEHFIMIRWARFEDEIREEARKAVLCWLATVDPNGWPNVSPKEIFEILDRGRVAIADVASPQSVRNVAENAKACVSFVDIFLQRGWKLIGRGRVAARGSAEEREASARLTALAGADFPIRNVLIVDVERVERIWAPSYVLFPERPPEVRAQAAYARYGVRPVRAER